MPTLSQEIKSLQAEVNDIETLFAAGNAFQEAAQKLKGNVGQKNNHYLISSVDFPLMN
ncbi:hypothetical protein [Lactococcus garvieae]|uniref:hypothetical protein n=1 Tax=Lactococcus garvieae TaxID=1363 RepID=UPI00254BE45C|nr:hypothetical protein [Lactococcus garvieae]